LFFLQAAWQIGRKATNTWYNNECVRLFDISSGSGI
jgi:hypothetical protein